MLLAGCGWLVVQWLDWSRLFSFAATGRWEEYLLSRQIKLLLSVIVAVLVGMTGREALSKRDRWLMCGVFGAVVAADVAFFLDNYQAGIGLFSLAQIVFIVRHATGVPALVRSGQRAKILWLSLAAIVIVLVNVVLIRVLFIRHADNSMFPFIIGYSILLCCSLWAGVTSGLTGSLPKVNSRLVALAVVVLYCGDLAVGLNIVLPHDRSYIISTSLTWFFYLPAIVLLALSGYRWRQRTTT